MESSETGLLKGEEMEDGIDHMKVEKKIRFKAFIDNGKMVNVWLPVEQVKELYKRTKTSFLKGLLLSMADRL